MKKVLVVPRAQDQISSVGEVLKCGVFRLNCEPEEAEGLLRQRQSQNEKKMDVVTRVRKSVKYSSGEVNTTMDGIANVSTLLGSGSDCRMASMSLVKALSKEKFLAIKKLKKPVKIESVGRTTFWVKRSVFLQCVEFNTSGRPLV